MEGLLLTYLLCAKQLGRSAFDARTEERLAAQRITFGQVKDALKAAGAFHDPALADAVEKFVAGRNEVAHHLAVRMKPFDLEDFFTSGREIAWQLWKHVLRETEAHRTANP